MKLKAIGYLIGMTGLMVQTVDLIESEHSKILAETHRQHTAALKKIDSDTYGIYRMLEIGFKASADVSGTAERDQKIAEIFKAYERRYNENAMEGMRESRQASSDLKEGLGNSIWSVLTLGYSVHSGDEMDLVVERGGRRFGFEFKASTNPGVTDSIKNCLRDLDLAKVYVVHPGEQDYSLGEKIHTVGVRNLVALQATWEQA